MVRLFNYKMNKALRISKLEEMVVKLPNDPFPNYALGLEYMSEEACEKAMSFFEKLITQHPDYLPTYYQMGLALEKLNEPKRAREIYRQGIALAKTTKDFKTKAELEEALSLLDD